MKVSFIVPLYNCLPLTQAMLASLQATLPAGLAHEVIFVDDGSTDGTRAWLAGLTAPCRAILNERNLGFAGACNRGAAAATGDFLYFLNNDLVLLPGWFEPMQGIVAGAAAGLIGNVQLNARTGAVDHTGIVINAKGKPEHDHRQPWPSRLTGRRPVVALTGACCAVRRARWIELGAFDERYVNGGEDIDFCLRARRAGYRNYVALRSVVRHHISQSPGRKQRDEQNSRRLLQQWRRDFAALVTRLHCPALVAVSWEEPRQYPDPQLALEALFHGCGLLPWPTPRLLDASDNFFEIEFRYWRHVLEGAPPPPANEEVVWQLRPLPPPPELVL